MPFGFLRRGPKEAGPAAEPARVGPGKRGIPFDGLTEALQAGNARGGDDPVARMREQGCGYVEFALRHPARFALMFSAVKPAGEPALARSGRAAFQLLEDGVRGLYGLAPGAALEPRHWNALLAIWSVVHGFAHLALAGRFDMLAGPGRREEWVRRVVGPMLQQQLEGLAPQEGSKCLGHVRGPRHHRAAHQDRNHADVAIEGREHLEARVSRADVHHDDRVDQPVLAPPAPGRDLGLVVLDDVQEHGQVVR